jgi:hypothetical protein
MSWVQIIANGWAAFFVLGVGVLQHAESHGRVLLSKAAASFLTASMFVLIAVATGLVPGG